MKQTDILSILADWNYWGNYKDESLERNLFLQAIRNFQKSGEIIVIKGVRRSGKSTIILQYVRKLIESGLPPKNTLIVNFEDPRFKKLDLDLLNQVYETYLEELLPDKEHYVVLDEVQEIDGWEKFARFLSEAKKVHVFITGSSSKLMSEEYATLLSGRHIDIEIFPLSFKEFLFFKGIAVDSNLDKTKLRHKIKNVLKEYLEFGGFPKVSLVRDVEKRAILSGYFQDILIKDIQRRFGVREIGKLEELAKYYLTNMATLQSFNRTRKIIGLSLDTVERFYKYFSIGRLFFFVPKFGFSLKEQILNPRKVYGIDVGLKNVAGFNFTEEIGRIMENVVFLELMRRGSEVFYWKSLRQKGIDFVVKDGKQITQLIQVCYSTEGEETRKREVSALIEGSEDLKCCDLLIITADFEAMERHEEQTIKFIPLWKWLI